MTMIPKIKRIMERKLLITKNSASHADVVGATLLSKEIIATHTVGAYAECIAIGKEALLDGEEKVFSAKEFRLYLILVVGIACHHHYAADAHMGKVLPFACFKHGETFFG